MTLQQKEKRQEALKDLRSFLTEQIALKNYDLRNLVYEAIEEMTTTDIYELLDYKGDINFKEFGKMKDIENLLSYYDLAYLLSCVDDFYDYDDFYIFTTSCLRSTDDITDYIDFEDLTDDITDSLIKEYTYFYDYISIDKGDKIRSVATDIYKLNCILNNLDALTELINEDSTEDKDDFETEDAENFDIDEELLK